MATVIEIPADLLVSATSTFRIGRRSLTSANPYTEHLRVSGPIDERWIADLTLTSKATRADLDRFDALFDVGDGLAGFFSAFDNAHGYPRGTATGLVKDQAGVRFSDGATFSDRSTFRSGQSQSTIQTAAARGAEYVAITGLVASQSTGFARGDMITISQGSEGYGFLHRVVADVATDASGNASVRIRPRLREAVAVGQVVFFLQARGIFRVADETFTTRDPGGIGQPRLSLVEVPEVLTCGL